MFTYCYSFLFCVKNILSLYFKVKATKKKATNYRKEIYFLADVIVSFHSLKVKVNYLPKVSSFSLTYSLKFYKRTKLLPLRK